MSWNVLLADEFKHWFIAQTEAMQADILTVIEVLQVRGPQLSRPHADTLNGSKHISGSRWAAFENTKR